MVKYIRFGEYNTNYKYIFYAFVIRFIAEQLVDISSNILFKYEIISENFIKLFYHFQIINSFIYLVCGVFAFIFYLYEKKVSRNESITPELNQENSEKGCFKNVKDFEDEKMKNTNKKSNFLNIILISISCILVEYSALFVSLLSIFNYWMVILIIISILNNKIFKLKTYKHQTLAKYFNFIVCLIFRSCSFILKLKSDEQNIYNKNIWLLPIGILAYLLYVFLSSFIYAKFKVFMDLEGVSPTILLMIYGISGFLINIIIGIIETFIKCDDNIKSYICYIIDEENKDDYYIDNFAIFFQRISNIYKEDKVDFLIFIIFVIIVSVLYFFSLYFCFIVLKKFTPEYYYFIGSAFEIFYYLITIFQSKIIYGYYFAEDGKDYKIPLAKFILDLIGNSLAFIGFLVYLGIIELNFCGFNYNLRKNIIDRSIKEATNNGELGDFNDNDSQNENLVDDKISKETFDSINNEEKENETHN